MALEVRARDVPTTTFGLQQERKHIGEQDVEGGCDVPRGFMPQIPLRVQGHMPPLRMLWWTTNGVRGAHHNHPHPSREPCMSFSGHSLSVPDASRYSYC